MNSESIQALTATFEGHAQQTETGIEYWLARDLQPLLGYTQWRNFLSIIGKAKIACERSNRQAEDHFADVSKMVDLGSGSQREIEDIMLTRYACYLIAQNGDPRKQEIAFAQTYFAIQTRRAELIETRLLEAERISARRKLSDTEKELSEVIYEQTGGNEDFGLIRSKGDQALFGKSTRAMKAHWNIPANRPWQILLLQSSLKRKTLRQKSRSLTPANIICKVKRPSPKNISQTIKLSATPSYNAAFVRRGFLQPRM
jgi:DNA-damage-inducible protein D